MRAYSVCIARTLGYQSAPLVMPSGKGYFRHAELFLIPKKVLGIEADSDIMKTLIDLLKYNPHFIIIVYLGSFEHSHQREHGRQHHLGVHGLLSFGRGSDNIMIIYYHHNVIIQSSKHLDFGRLLSFDWGSQNTDRS